MHIRLWHSPYNSIYISFQRANLRRCQVGWGDLRKDHVNWSLWWAIFGFSGGAILQSWPWQRHPSTRSPQESKTP